MALYLNRKPNKEDTRVANQPGDRQATTTTTEHKRKVGEDAPHTAETQRQEPATLVAMIATASAVSYVIKPTLWPQQAHSSANTLKK